MYVAGAVEVSAGKDEVMCAAYDSPIDIPMV